MDLTLEPHVGKFATADLATCDREPIHIPGSIQPFGVLLGLDRETLLIEDLSANSQDVIGLSNSALLGRSLLDLIFAEDIASFRENLQCQPASTIDVRLQFDHTVTPFSASVHCNQNKIIVELEPKFSSRFSTATAGLLKGALSALRAAKDLESLCDITAKQIRKITSFDRVVSYRFDREWNGHVVAEDRLESVDSFLDLHFPASDIPKQARELYAKNWIRFIPDVNYKAVPILSQANSDERSLLDLSQSVLRSVSPIHIEYLHNMGVSASMSISLMHEKKLWGLISCTHHHGPNPLSAEIRTTCEFLGEIVSSLLAAKEANEDSDYRIRLNAIQANLLQRMTQSKDFLNGLVEAEKELLQLTNATGAAIYFGEKSYVLGIAPNDEQIRSIITYLGTQKNQDVYATDSLPQKIAAAEEFKSVACGVIAISMSLGKNNYVLWFRPEVLQTVKWGGNPKKVVEVREGSARIHPRKSFELWKETVKLKSLPWREVEKDAATGLRASLIGIVLQRAEELSKLNIELERSNIELDSFAYAASHDLKEPLRGIHNYASLVIRESKTNFSDLSQSRMQTIVKLTQRMENLIDSLLHYAQVGRMDLNLRVVDTEEVVSRTLDMMRTRIDETHARIEVQKGLPAVRADRVQIEEVFANLITNALKYNDKADKHVAIGFTASPDLKFVNFFVRDNGIGIREKHFETIFRIFKRLHKRDEFGGGSGTGLTITRRIIERHGGTIVVESQPTIGSTIRFSLPSEI